MPYTALKNAVLSEKIDWIAYSQAVTLEWDFPDYIDTHWKDVRPLRNYTHGQENKQGVRRYWNVERASQGRFVVLPGVASGILQEYQSNFLQWVSTTDRKATRIDYAIDITHSQFRPSAVRRHLLNGDARTHALSALRTGDIFTEGDTQYVGKKSSETYTRIYDKSVEQKTDFEWVRVETVYQGERANPSLQAYCECKSTRALIKRHVDFPNWRDWCAIMSGDVAQFTVPLKETATRAWLLGQVAQAMAKELIRDEEHSFWFEFQDRVKWELDRLEDNHNVINF